MTLIQRYAVGDIGTVDKHPDDGNLQQTNYTEKKERKKYGTCKDARKTAPNSTKHSEQQEEYGV
jgi:hypothetical protein